ncbi:RNA polymerase sigma-70 factor [Larkinella knui]|uniref:RNA polymerase sigma-70 factor n=1 Tax=Larkinella knui TaxID=2025310 RepID=A0A3P1CQ46_9BACT|nr:RNA polymerase sigma-70 factor [Larkinella knui]RRB15443.1 RNA polymerase sigma-70 factor [Larkinella knui]
MKPDEQKIASFQSNSHKLRISKDSEETKVISEDYFIQNYFTATPKTGFELLFRKYYTNLCNHAIRYVYSKEIAEDIVAEVFTNFWNNRVYETITTSYSSYLYTSVKNRAYNYIKLELNRNENLDSENEDAGYGDNFSVLQPDEILHYHELSRKLEAAIQRLPKQSRKAFQLNRLEGKKYSEVAAEMELTVSAVERLISRALSKIREELKQEYLLNLFLMFIFSY